MNLVNTMILLSDKFIETRGKKVFKLILHHNLNFGAHLTRLSKIQLRSYTIFTLYLHIILRKVSIALIINNNVRFTGEHEYKCTQ